MIRKPPLRTYSKKTFGQPVLQLPKESIANKTSSKHIQLNSNSVTTNDKENNSSERSLDYDPFDTTFDRLLRSPRVKAVLASPEKKEDLFDISKNYVSSSDNSSNQSSLSPHIGLALCSNPAGQNNTRKRNGKQVQMKTLRIKLNRIDEKIIKKPQKKTKAARKYVQRKKVKQKEDNLPSIVVEASSVNVPEKKKIEMKDCFIRLTRLDAQDFLRPINNNIVISSTPVGKSKKSVIENVSISPIHRSKIDTQSVSNSQVVRLSVATNDNNTAILPREQLEQYDINKHDNSLQLITSMEQIKNETILSSSALLSPVSNVTTTEDAHFTTEKETSLERQSKVSDICSVRTEAQSAILQQMDIDSNSNTNVDNDVTNNASMPEDRSKLANNASVIQTSCSMFDDTNYENDKLSTSRCTTEVLSVHNSNMEETKHTEASIQFNNSHSLFSNTEGDNKMLHGSLSVTSEQSQAHSNNSLESLSTVSVARSNETEDTNTDEKENIEENGLNDFQLRENIETSKPAKSIERRRLRESVRSNKNDIETLEQGTEEEKSEVTTFLEPRVLLTRLHDPVRVTERRKRYRNWDLLLTNISEVQNETSKLGKSHRNSRRQSNDSKSDIKAATKSPKNSLTEEDVSETQNELSEANRSISEPGRTVFLKPGKFWARSLSILNNVQSGANLNALSIGKGRKWGSSVRDVLDMQNQGVIQSCVKKQNAEKESSLHYEPRVRQSAPANSKFKGCRSFSLSRFSRRISVRIVPDTNNEQRFEDTSILAACAITPQDSENLLTKNARKSAFEDVLNDVGVVEEATARKIVLQQCSQEDYISFTNCYPESYLDHCRKIGEGVYGEVFLYDNDEHKSVIKIIPIEGSELVNGEPQKKFNEILSEIVIAKELHNLRSNKNCNTSGFVEVKSIKCIIGKYPQKLVELWKTYDEDKNSDNDCPTLFNENQLYIALELGHGGQDLEAFVFMTAEEAYSSFIQTALALAVAEKSLEFEHRDLHWGNILIARTDEQFVSYKFNDKEILLPTKGVKVSIIDFTLSRMSYQGCYMYNDLALDPALFTAQGEYQFEIYRLMRDRVQNDWQMFEPYTNVLWLHYTLDKMITAVRYKRKNLKIHKSTILKLKELKDEILNYDSAADFVSHSDKLTDVLCNKATSVMLPKSANNNK